MIKKVFFYHAYVHLTDRRRHHSGCVEVTNENEIDYVTIPTNIRDMIQDKIIDQLGITVDHSNIEITQLNPLN